MKYTELQQLPDESLDLLASEKFFLLSQLSNNSDSYSDSELELFAEEKRKEIMQTLIDCQYIVGLSEGKKFKKSNTYILPNEFFESSFDSGVTSRMDNDVLSDDAIQLSSAHIMGFKAGLN